MMCTTVCGRAIRALTSPMPEISRKASITAIFMTGWTASSDSLIAADTMGVELFEMSWVQSIVLFFSYLAWALYGTGLVVSAFETGIEYQHGRGSVKDTALNAIKGFMAVSLFTIVPVELFKLSVNLQSSLTAGITGYGTSFGDLAGNIISELGSSPDMVGAML